MSSSHKAIAKKVVDTEGLGRWTEWGQLGDIRSVEIW